MARAVGEKAYSPLVGGLVTEASPLSAPEGTTSDEKNFILDLNGGIRKRRKGFENANDDFDQTENTSTDGSVLEVFYWREADLFVVCTVFDNGVTYLRFHSNNSAYSYLGQVTLSGTELLQVQIDEVRGNLIVTGNNSANSMTPLLVEKDGSTINSYRVKVYVRDFELLDDSIGVADRPVSLTDEHKYNLYNAGWYANRPLASSGSTGSPLTNFFTLEGVYPSNADIPVLGLKTDEDGNEEFDPDTLIETVVGSTEAPRGHYVFPIDDFDRNDKLTNFNVDGTVSTSLTLESSISI